MHVTSRLIGTGLELDMVCVDLWSASRPCFTLMPADDRVVVALDKLSSRVR